MYTHLLRIHLLHRPLREARCSVLVEFKHFHGPWFQRWAPFPRAASQDLLEAAKAFSASIDVTPAPLLYSATLDAPRPKQKSLECVLWAANSCFSPLDGVQDAIPREVLKRWMDSEAHAELHSGVLQSSDFLAELKRNKEVETTWSCRLSYITSFFEKNYRGLSFRKLKGGRAKTAIPLKNYPVIRTHRGLNMFWFVFCVV
jgi:hypothetical protein